MAGNVVKRWCVLSEQLCRVDPGRVLVLLLLIGGLVFAGCGGGVRSSGVGDPGSAGQGGTEGAVATEEATLATVDSGVAGAGLADADETASSDETIGRLDLPLVASYLDSIPVVKEIEAWPLPEVLQDRSTPGCRITTPHYLIYTTLQDPLLLRQLPVFLESAHQHYSEVTGARIPDQDHRFVVYMFDTRGQWEDYTRYWTGERSTLYLKIRAGAYYLNGACIAYHLSRQSNMSVLAHECWHQYCDEVFKYRLPTWLDEGLATNFESHIWDEGRVRFIPAVNANRLIALKKALETRQLYTLNDLLVLDPGRVLSHQPDLSVEPYASNNVATYYAQTYALVRFLRESRNARLLIPFYRMVRDGYRGKWPISQELRDEATQREQNPSRRWNAIVGPLVFRLYIAREIKAIEQDYRDYCRKLVNNARFFKKQL